MKKIKLIWEFYGPDSYNTAKHHEHHLEEYVEAEKLINNITGYEKIDDLTAYAYMVVEEEEMQKVIDALLPKRGILYEG